MAGRKRAETALVNGLSKTRDVDRYLETVRDAWRRSGQRLTVAALLLDLHPKQAKRWLVRAGISVDGHRRVVVPLIQRAMVACCGDAHGRTTHGIEDGRSGAEPRSDLNADPGVATRGADSGSRPAKPVYFGGRGRRRSEHGST